MIKPDNVPAARAVGATADLRPILGPAQASALLDYNPETGAFRWKRTIGARAIAGEPAGFMSSRGYHLIRIYRREYKAHRLAWLICKGTWPSDMIDHINRDRGDNRLCNLRDATPTLNSRNQGAAHRHNRCRRIGVSEHEGKYQARIGVGGRKIALGTFSDPEDAAAAYVAAKRKLHGILI